MIDDLFVEEESTRLYHSLQAQRRCFTNFFANFGLRFSLEVKTRSALRKFALCFSSHRKADISRRLLLTNAA